MIFVTVGNHYQGFNRLLKRVDEIAHHLPHEIIIQKGYSDYYPKNTKYFDFVPINDAMEYVKISDLVISHAGIGTIILCKEYGIPLLIFPRRKKYGEHSNDHQMEIAKAIEERRDENIYVVYEENQLEAKMVEISKTKRQYTPRENVGKTSLIKTIKAFIEEGD